MNWIDKKYRDSLGQQQFSDSEKARGWAGMESILDKQMPVSFWQRRWVKFTGSVGLLMLIGLGSWLFWPEARPDAQWLPALENQSSQDVSESTPQSGLKSLSRDDEEAHSVAAENPAGQPAPSQVEAASQPNSPAANAVNSDESMVASNSLLSDKDENIKPATTPPAGGEVDTRKLTAAEPELVAGNVLAGSAPATRPESVVSAADHTANAAVGVDQERPAGQSFNGGNTVGGEGNQALSPAAVTVGNKESPSDYLQIEPRDVAEQLSLATTGSDKEIRLDSNTIAASTRSGYKLPDLENLRLSIRAFGGYNYVGKRLEHYNDEYSRYRSENEKAIYTFNQGWEVSYQISSQLFISSGFEYARYGEVLDYQMEQVDTAYLDGRYHHFSDLGGRIIQLDSVRIITGIYQGHWNYRAEYAYNDTAVEANNGQTEFAYLEIPLLLGYRFTRGRLKPYLQSGLSLGLPLHQRYRYLNDQLSGLESNENTGLKPPLQWNYKLRLGAEYTLAPHWSVQFDLNSSWQLKDMLEQSEARQRYYRIGAQLGLAYTF